MPWFRISTYASDETLTLDEILLPEQLSKALPGGQVWVAQPDTPFFGHLFTCRFGAGVPCLPVGHPFDTDRPLLVRRPHPWLVPRFFGLVDAADGSAACRLSSTALIGLFLDDPSLTREDLVDHIGAALNPAVRCTALERLGRRVLFFVVLGRPRKFSEE